MNVSRTAPGAQLPDAGLPTPEANTRQQAEKNAVNSFQAKYGEKPKEARVIKKSLDKDDFMRIMVTEMKHQDPTKPMDSDRMATQMAQITSVEQLKNVGTAIDKLADKNSTSDRLAMSTMIGKTVTVDKGRFAHQKGTLSPINFDLPADANKVKLTILNEKGEEVAVRELEPMKAGANAYNWDGLNSSSIQSPSSNYVIHVDAEDAKGQKIKVDSVSKETVVGITFDGGEANFLVGDTKNPQKVAFKSVTRIEGDAPSRAAAGIAKDSLNKSLSDETSPLPKALPSDLPTGLQERLKTEMQSRAQAHNSAQVDDRQALANSAVTSAKMANAQNAQVQPGPPENQPPVKAEGFPNGLGD
jgi:flagellar basal-body rod modification protein FlgD